MFWLIVNGKQCQFWKSKILFSCNAPLNSDPFLTYPVYEIHKHHSIVLSSSGSITILNLIKQTSSQAKLQMAGILTTINPIRHGFFQDLQSGGEGGGEIMLVPHHNLVVFAPMTTIFATVIERDVLHIMVTKIFVTLSLLHNYDVITCIYETHRPKFQTLVISEPFA